MTEVRVAVRALSLLLMACAANPGKAASPGAGTVIDECAYASDAAAAAVWTPMRGSKPAVMAEFEGQRALRLRCAFADGKAERGSWDRKVKLDLSKARGVQFKVFCRNPSPVSYFSIYFQSGEGWYHAIFSPESLTEWNTIEVDKSEMKSEGKPAGWDQIKTIRVSAWKIKNADTEFHFSDLRATDPRPPAGPRELAEAAIASIGEIASFKRFESVTNEIIRLDGGRAAKQLSQAVESRAAATASLERGKFAEAKAQATAAREHLLAAYCLAQKAEPGEFRGFWCHNAFGVEGINWDEAIRRLAANGFTAILPNMLWGGAAFYDSKVLPVAREAKQRGDQIRQCLAACRKYGVQIHVWKVDWNLGRSAPADFVAKMRQEGRLQKDAHGKEEPWLCPSNPENQKLEIAAMVEVVRNYEVDGIHFDYIRYPDNDHCFCEGCRERFRRSQGKQDLPWPQAVLSDGPLRQQWLEWRRSNITTVVRSVSEEARAIKPRIKLSAAVFRNWAVDRDGVGQDWKLWCDQGYLDFVCPMDYTPSNSRFDAMVSQQVEWAGKTPCYPGLGVSASSSRFGADRAIEQINIARRHQTHGFMIFNYGAKESQDLLPKLGMGITAKLPQ